MVQGVRSFWSSGTGILLLTLLILIAGVSGLSILLIHDVTHPSRSTTSLDPADLSVRVEEIEFEAADGIPLSGWFVRGRPGWPAILLCHDLGSSRLDLLATMVPLSRSGYPILMFDFRGHGMSGGGGATLGILERLDIIGAIEHLKQRDDIDTGRVGILGIGQGAYAAALAALEREEIRVLALDSIYPDVATQLDRLIGDRLPPLLQRVVPVVGLFYDPYLSFRMKGSVISESIGVLADRNILFIAAARTPGRFREQQKLYEALPDDPSGDSSFIEMEGSGVTGLYGEERKAYDETIVSFFSRNLRGGGAQGRGSGNPLRVVDP